MTKVFVNGTFDVLHRGHLALLNYARSQGDEVAVAVDTDARVKEMKGESRPVNCCLDRMEMLRALKFVTKLTVIPRDSKFCLTLPAMPGAVSIPLCTRTGTGASGLRRLQSP